MKHIHILVVDDEKSNRVLLKEMLEEYSVIEAHNSHSMWNMLQHHHINLILLDVMMPEEDGFSLGKKLYNHTKYTHIPIIYVSAKVSGTDIDKGFKSGAVDYIKKPFDIYELHNRVENAISKTEQTHQLKTQAITADMVFQQIQDSIIITDTEFMITKYNPACSNLLGYNDSELRNTCVSDIIFNKSHTSLHISSLVNTQTDAYVCTKEDDLVPVSISIKPLVDDVQIELGWLCVMHNMQKQKEIEQNLINAKNESELASKMKSTFLTRISHEIRTPLNAILGFSDLLNSEHSSGDEKSHYTTIIKKNGNKLLSFIDNLLNISSIETEKLAIEKKDCYIYELCQKLKKEFTAQLVNYSQNKVKLIVLPNIPVDFTIQTDQNKLYKSLHNVLDNACKFTHKGEILFSCSITDAQLQFHIEDTGIGIHKYQLENIFESFQKIEEYNDTNISQGIGVGLSISKNYIDILGGEITISSQKEKGTLVHISFPI
ncbi:MAG: response regulator [Bacteroidales bacterium]